MNVRRDQRGEISPGWRSSRGLADNLHGGGIEVWPNKSILRGPNGQELKANWCHGSLLRSDTISGVLDVQTPLMQPRSCCLEVIRGVGWGF